MPHSARGYCTTCYTSARQAGEIPDAAPAAWSPMPRTAAASQARQSALADELRGSWLITRPALDDELLRRARLVVSEHATDLDDYLDLLDVLGLSYDATASAPALAVAA